MEDLFSLDYFLSDGVCAQVHHPPYLFEAFLLQPIDDVGSSARVTDSAVFLRLLKRTPEPWEGLLTHAGM